MNKKDFFASIIAGVFIGVFAVIVANNLFEGSYYNFDGWMLGGIWFACFGLVSFFSGLGKVVSKKIPAFYEIIKFVIVGGLNTLVDFGVLNLLMTVFHETSGWWYSVFKTVSFIVAVFNSYWWNKVWTFSSNEETNTNRIMRFLTVSVIGMGVNVVIATVIVSFFPLSWGLSDTLIANIGAVAGTALSMVWNFVGYKFFVFHKNKKGEVFAN